MENRWDAAEAARHAGDIEQRIYSSRLIGQDQALVRHGGGNTSVKIMAKDVFGADEDLLYIKGSGFDLQAISAAGFASVRTRHLVALSGLEHLSDIEMARQLRLATVDPAAPAPSVEAILHAVLPYRYFDHAHADAVIALTNTPSGDAHVRAAYGDRVLLVPYVMPGFELSRVVARMVADELGAPARGLILAGHGLFSFGNTARESYDRLIDLVTIAEDYLKEHGAWDLSEPAGPDEPGGPAGIELAQLRSQLSGVAGVPLLLQRQDDPLARDFARRPDVAALSQRGPATPDHAIRTKRVPLVGRDVAAYARAYREYFERGAALHPAGADLRMLDPAPRVILDEQLRLCTAARRQGDAPEFTGEVALVTGAASGIGRACAEGLARNGAAVCGVDIDPRVEG